MPTSPGSRSLGAEPRSTPAAYYDGVADWYDAYLTGGSAANAEAVGDLVGRLLGAGAGTCLDLGCGTGVHTAKMQALGWRMVSIDLSRDQLRVAVSNQRVTRVALASAEHLPFIDQAFDAVMATHIHTDVDDWEQVMRETARVLRPGGRMVYVGSHPCFIGAFARFQPDGTRVLHPGYGNRTRIFHGPGIGTGIRGRVGERHIPLADMIMAVLDAGLHLEHLAEAGTQPLPPLLGIMATRPSASLT